MLVKVPCTLKFPGFSASLAPINPVNCTYYTGRNRSYTFLQFSATLAYAITDHKCQGITIKTNRVIINLTRPASSGKPLPSSPYVQLSRAQTLTQLCILRPFDPDELQNPLLPKLLEELQQWQPNRAAQQTILSYGFDEPSSDFHFLHFCP